jgi:hypothetical protein
MRSRAAIPGAAGRNGIIGVHGRKDWKPVRCGAAVEQFWCCVVSRKWERQDTIREFKK